MNLRRTILIAATALLLALPAFAGPPLLCWPFDIGGARSLPFGGEGWKQSDPNYEVRRVVTDTLALLTPETAVIVRMETMRRATVYGMNNPAIAQVLLDKLQARYAYTKAAGDAAATAAEFDYGYLIETYRQAALVTGHSGQSNAGQANSGQPNASQPNSKVQPRDGTTDGYALITDAIAHGGGPQMEFAAAAAASLNHRDDIAGHVQRARAASAHDPMLARNLATHFSETVASK